ncbi:unnamed protein product [Medioppia subpectinata]|uniref:Neurotransmitter-gated ion-channel ligand-binding domain-containing protein n=1 Tax=Medioppia subpectinata TaxID=1979941 RepID=A0A7R9KYA3_9ACAR|nr:unnamed protein product [Medioppia subpectinata]CAG2111890.1 unnamed protein product [Medioppia subpectinata]
MINESEPVKSLRNELFVKRKYDKYSLPVNDHNQAVNVSIWIRILKIVDLDIKTQILTLNAYMDLYYLTYFIMFETIELDAKYWTDEGLQWNPSDFGGQTQLIVSSDLIWKPDIGSTNSPNAFRYDQQIRESTAIVYSSGGVDWMPQTMINTYCMTDLKDYPSDRQTCEILVESTYESRFVNLQSLHSIYAHGQLSTYVSKSKLRFENREWSVVNVEAKSE